MKSWERAACARFVSPPVAKAKSGGVRVIYYYYAESIPLYALMIYGKNEKADLSAAERKVVSALAAAIKKAARQRK